MSYRPFVEALVRSVVEHPEDVRIEEEVDGSTRIFFVHVAPDDVGKVIGKSGRVVSAIRCVVSAVAAREREKAFVKVPTED
ncbi:MAG: KH domain-containing protein [Fimbriimonas ginsengisoli]|uniref:RNA-binding protein KhpA n=1 Tax=Fimbriimonas ginsengisoli TaxID=1005039 RepID=A0A931LSR7_FIMGI|nr:KH domain-containing protein [Fimbriimonas ginsengisoli]MBI3721687.1 KH domain-containing protein [Fimbriimonas ginsengisoli]